MAAHRPRRQTVQAAGETASGRYTDDFAREQERLGNALLRLKAVDGGSPHTGREFTALASEYNRLLQWARDTASLTGSMCQKIYELHDLMQQDPLTGIRCQLRQGLLPEAAFQGLKGFKNKPYVLCRNSLPLSS